MTVSDIITKLDLTPVTGPFDKSVTGGYASDMLSDVLAHGEENFVWVTIQIHRNIVAVASMKNLAAIIISGGRKPEEITVADAHREQINLLTTPLSTYEVVGKLYALGVG
ncbi:serine kinase [Candidatus Poribacteria bacterium]|nr:serine kinase [Candidatus Poribacteria bacterium]